MSTLRDVRSGRYYDISMVRDLIRASWDAEDSYPKGWPRTWVLLYSAYRRPNIWIYIPSDRYKRAHLLD